MAKSGERDDPLPGEIGLAGRVRSQRFTLSEFSKVSRMARCWSLMSLRSMVKFFVVVSFRLSFDRALVVFDV